MPTLSINSKMRLSGNDAKEFFDFLTEQKQKNISFFKKGEQSFFHSHFISFDESVVCEDLDAQGRYTCNFLGQKIGEGTFAKVYDISQSLTVSNIDFRPFGYQQSQVVKVQRHCGCVLGACGTHNSFKMLQQEYEISTKAAHLGIHRAVFNYAKRVSYTLMNKLPGKELFKILIEDFGKKPRIPLQQRLELSLGLLQSAKTQLVDMSIIHFDIKPENIIVDLSKMPMMINFVDFAFGQKIQDGRDAIMTSRRAGSIGYAAPEVMLSFGDYFATHAVDLFSLMRVILIIWGGYNDSFKASRPSEYASHLKKPENLNDLFISLPPEQRVLLRHLGLDNLIKTSLRIGLARDPRDRGTMDEAIRSYQKILDIYMQSLQTKPESPVGSKQIDKPMEAYASTFQPSSLASVHGLFQSKPNITHEAVSEITHRVSLI